MTPDKNLTVEEVAKEIRVYLGCADAEWNKERVAEELKHIEKLISEAAAQQVKEATGPLVEAMETFRSRICSCGMHGPNKCGVCQMIDNALTQFHAQHGGKK